MARKDVYEYTLRLDSVDTISFANEEGPLEKPENSISYMLVGILSCMAITVKPILEKMRIGCDAVSVNGKLYMVNAAVRYSDRIECTMRLENAPQLDADTQQRIIELTKKHCSVSVTIANNPSITLAMA
jgi:uncharacterized OsmC-like protein